MLIDKASFLHHLQAAGVTDPQVLAAMEAIPREAFVPPGQQPEAYSDRALPIACGQTISQPVVVGLMTQALSVEKTHKVLEVGTGSGYQAAILSRLCRRLYSIERHRELHSSASQRFEALRLRNITTLLGDGWKGWAEQGPFDRIIVTAAADEIPQTLVDQLSIGGVMVAPIGEQYQDQEVLRIVRQEDGVFYDSLFPVRFVPMVRGLAAGARW
jgi:protein-L-isoaspartate(D-aspartate) O-methyltransferase